MLAEADMTSEGQQLVKNVRKVEAKGGGGGGGGAGAGAAAASGVERSDQTIDERWGNFAPPGGNWEESEE